MSISRGSRRIGLVGIGALALAAAAVWLIFALERDGEAGAAAAGTGSLSGRIMYPSQGIPPLRIVAIPLDGGDAQFVETALNQDSYRIDSLPPGRYHVLGYVSGSDPEHAGGYTEMVPCGLSVNCEDHSLIAVTVVTGEETSNVDVADWYAGPGAFPMQPW